MKCRKTTLRNREIFADYRKGMSYSEISASRGLTRATVVAIICIEKHRLEVSEDSFYQQLRESLGMPSFFPADAAE